MQRFPPKQKTKVAFDSSLTIIAVIISFILFRELQGVREGTVIAAVVVGMAVRFYKKNFGGIEKRYIVWYYIDYDIIYLEERI